jgi:hypothetical protein
MVVLVLGFGSFKNRILCAQAAHQGNVGPIVARAVFAELLADECKPARCAVLRLALDGQDHGEETILLIQNSLTSNQPSAERNCEGALALAMLVLPCAQVTEGPKLAAIRTIIAVSKFHFTRQAAAHSAEVLPQSGRQDVPSVSCGARKCWPVIYLRLIEAVHTSSTLNDN